VPVDDPRLTRLLFQFTQLSTSAQARFLDLLNDYLFASPRLRGQLRRKWQLHGTPEPGSDPRHQGKSRPGPMEPPKGSA